MTPAAVCERSSANLWITGSAAVGHMMPDPGLFLTSLHIFIAAPAPSSPMSAAMASCLSAAPTICSSSRAAPVAHCGVSQVVLLPSARTAFRGGRIVAPSTGCARRQIDTTCRAVRTQTISASC